MPAYEVNLDNHLIGMSYNLWNGLETISVDGNPILRKRSLRLVTPHNLSIHKDGQEQRYNLLLGAGVGYVILKNGSIVAEHRRPFMSYIEAVGFLAVCLILAQLMLRLSVFFAGETLGGAGRIVDPWSSAFVFLGALPVAWWRLWHLRKVAERYLC